MKYLAWFGGILVTILVSLYVLAFTPFGNSILQPVVEAKIKEATKLDSKLNTFSLNMSSFEIFLELNSNNRVLVKGSYSLFWKAFDITYELKLDELKTLKSLTGVELRKSFFTSGSAKGDTAFMEVDGVSNLALSDTTYHIELSNFNPTSIIAKVKNLKLDALLDIAARKPYASANVNLDINFKSIKLHALDGDVTLRTTDGKINTKVMKKDFDITIPRTDFRMNLEAKLKDETIDYSYKLMSNLFKINSSGEVIPSPLKTDIKYAIDIKELALLKPVTGADLRGAFKLNGNVKGTKEKLLVDGKSDLASSDTWFIVTMKDFTPSTLKASVKNLKLARLLYMAKQPHYGDGVFSLDADITDARNGKLKGKVVTTLRKGLIDSKYMTKAYEFTTPMPRTTFNMSTDTTLNSEMLDTKIDLNSNLANFDIKRARVNLKDGSLLSDYKVKIPNLDKLFFVTDQHMKGAITLNGELKKNSDLDLTIHSKVAGGNIDAKLHNDDFHADIISMQTLDILHMLIYPEIFNSSLDAKLDYNLATQKGDFSGYLTDGKFTKNQMFGLLKQYAHIDLYREKFKGDVSAKINREKILASLDIKSRKASIKTRDTKLNSKTNRIDSKIKVVADKQLITFTLKGKTESPKVSIDMKQLMESKAGDSAKKEINRLFKKLF